MSELDEVSMRIGLLTGQVESLDSKIEHLIGWIKDSNSKVEAALTEHRKEDKKEFDEMRIKVQGLESFKKNIIAIASVCSLALTGVVHIVIAVVSGKHSS